eukprot:scaffold20920_cov67-Phaeocystis_antarctica.AAC.6
MHGSMAPTQQLKSQPQPCRGMRKADLVAVAAVGAGHLGAPRPVQHTRVLLHEQSGVDVVAIRAGVRARSRRRKRHVPLDLMPQDGGVGDAQRLERFVARLVGRPPVGVARYRMWREQKACLRLHKLEGALGGPSGGKELSAKATG